MNLHDVKFPISLPVLYMRYKIKNEFKGGESHQHECNQFMPKMHQGGILFLCLKTTNKMSEIRKADIVTIS